MATMNKLLERQIQKVFGDKNNVPSTLSLFLQTIDETYNGFDQDRSLTERSMDLSSQELLEANKQLREESEKQKETLINLKNAIAVLRPNNNTSQEWLTSQDDIAYLAASLSKLIAQEKQFEEELKISQSSAEKEKAKAMAILRSIGDGVFAVDLNQNIILMNAVAEKLSGFTFQESKGRNYGEIFRFLKENDPDSPYPPFIEDVIRTGEIKALQNHTLLINKKGEKISISDSAAPIRDDKDQTFGCIVVIRDASKERELERSKDEFISIAAHQLRTPLGSMRWNIETILNTQNKEDTTREKMIHIYQSNLRMTTLVNDLLNVSRIDQGIIKDIPELTDIAETIKIAINEMDAEMQKHNVSIDIKLPVELLPKIMIDPKLLQEVVQNLLSNAIKYSISGGKVTVAAISLADKITISVSDQGIGIPLADQPKVFSKFYRAQNALQVDTTGSGLGLFVVKAYVERWGGKVSFESVENKGTTFSIELPMDIKYSQQNEDRNL